MPPKQSIVLQHELGSDEEVENFLGKDGLSVVDVYAKWCGPCKAIVSLFKRVKNEIGDDLLRFATVCCDSIEKFKDYRGRCEPTFLFYATGGVLVAALHGPNGPLIEKTIHQQLAREHKVLEGNADRMEVEDTYLIELQEKAAAAEAAAEAERNRIIPIRKQAALLLVKPDIVSDEEKMSQLLEKITDAELDILKKVKKELGQEETAELLKDFKETDLFEEMVEFVASGPCLVLVLSKGEDGSSAASDLAQLVGPADPEKAQEDAPESLCAKFGTDAVHNAVFATTAAERVEEDLALLLPRYKVPWVPHTAPPMQLGLILIGPAYLEQHKDGLLQQIEETDLVIKRTKEIVLTKEVVDGLYAELAQSDEFEAVSTQMTSGPSLAMLVEHDAIPVAVGELLGSSVPGEGEAVLGGLRSSFSVEDVLPVCLHGSSSLAQAENEVQLLFPMQQTLAIIKPSAMDHKAEIIERVRLAGFHIAIQEEKQLDKAVSEDFYVEHREKDFFGELTEFMSSGPILAAVLSAHDCILSWRNFIGPTDPEQAKTDVPESIRALYGTAVMHNAVHGSATLDDAQREIRLLFGDVEFDEHGQLVEKEESKEEEADGDGGEAAKENGGEDGSKVENGDGETAGKSTGDEAKGDSAEGREATGDATTDRSTEEGDNTENLQPAKDGESHPVNKDEAAKASNDQDGKDTAGAEAATPAESKGEEQEAAAPSEAKGKQQEAAGAPESEGEKPAAASSESKDAEEAAQASENKDATEAATVNG